MSNEVAVKEAAGVPAQADQLKDLGFSSSDILIPRLRLMQGTTEEVCDEKFKIGDIVDSITGEKIGGVGEAIEVVPIHVFKTWRIYRMDGDFKARGGKLIKVDPVTSENEKQAWEGEEEIDGKRIPVRRDLSYNAFALIKNDLETGGGFPVNVIFKRTSANAGKQLVSLIYRLGMMGTPMFGKSVLLSSAKTKKETNTYAVFEVKTGKLVDKDHQGACLKWQSIVKTANVRTDESDDEETEAKAKTPVVVTGSPTTGSPEESPY